jgi:hypothetical protein
MMARTNSSRLSRADESQSVTMKRSIASLATVVLLALPSFAAAQNPEDKQPSRSGPSESEMSNYVGQIFDVMLAYLGKPETAAKVASIHKSYLEALMKEGFSRQEAMSIITSPNFLHLNSK